MRYAKNLSIIALVIFLITGMAGLTFAAPQSSQLPSSGNQVPLVFPDLRNVEVNIRVETNPAATTPAAGDQVRIHCDYYSCGCFASKLFSNRIDIDGALFYEKEGAWVAGGNNYPQSCSPEMCYSYSWPIVDTWKATPGSHTITCILDSKDNIYEGPQHELNNSKSITINVPLPKSAIEKLKDMKTKQTIPIPVPTPGVR